MQNCMIINSLEANYFPIQLNILQVIEQIELPNKDIVYIVGLKYNLQMNKDPQSVILDKDHNQFIEELKNGQNNILVVVRSRPLNQKELVKSDFETIKILDNRVVVLLDPSQELNQDDVLRKNRNKEMQFAFDFAFDKDTDQAQIYKSSASFLIKGIFEGYNGTVFAYGSTGAGKTYTMIGEPDNVGIMERSMDDLFKIYQEQISYIEIYNEQIKDLLTARDKNLDLREDPSQGVVVNGITEIEVKNTQEILHLLKIGNKNRTIESTGANEVSSRSHAVLQVQLQMKDKAAGINEEIQYSKLSLVDLAGSERAANTQNRGIRLIEGAKINQSLLVLGNCIQALSEANEKGIKNPFIQYRGSKLTRLLKDSLGGNCRTVMIANVSSYVYSFEDTYNTLNYANRAKNIKTQVQRNYLNVDNHISNYTHLIDNLKKENQNLKKLLQNKSLTLSPDQLETFSNQNQNQQENIKQIELKIAEHFKEELELKRKIFKLDEKMQEAQFEQFKLQTESKKLKDGTNESIQNKERIKDNLQIINTQSKSKMNFEKQLTNLNENQQMLQKENAKIQYKEKKQEAINIHQEMQIQFLKDQLKVRDEIINDQKNILNKNQINNMIQYETLVEMDDIEAQVSPTHNDYSFCSFRQGVTSQASHAHSLPRESERKKIVQSEKVRLRSHSKNLVSINQSPQRSTEKLLQNVVKLPQIVNQNISIRNNSINQSNDKSRNAQRYTNTTGDQTEPSFYGQIANINQKNQQYQQLKSQKTRQDNSIHKEGNNSSFAGKLDNSSKNVDQSSLKVIQRKLINPNKQFFERSNSKKKINYYENFQKNEKFTRQRSLSKNINNSYNEGLFQDYQNQSQIGQENNESMPPINKYYYKNDKTSFLTYMDTSNNNESRFAVNQTENSFQNNHEIQTQYATNLRQNNEETQQRILRSTSSSIFSNSNANNNSNQINQQKQNKKQQITNLNSSLISNNNNNNILNFLNNDLKVQNISKTEISTQYINSFNTFQNSKDDSQPFSGQEIHSSRKNNNDSQQKDNLQQINEDKYLQRIERLRQLNLNIKYLKQVEAEQNQQQISRENNIYNNKQITKVSNLKSNMFDDKKQNDIMSNQPRLMNQQYQQILTDPSSQRQQQTHQKCNKKITSKIISSNINNQINQKKVFV